MIAYKYRGGYNFDRDLESIAGDYFYAASLDKLNDPFEATYSTAPIDEFMRAVEVLLGEDEGMAPVKSSLQGVINQVAQAGIFSLAERFDDMKLWAHYGASHTGFCVGYDVGRLEKFNGLIHYTHYLVQVKYSENPGSLTFDDLSRGVTYVMQKMLGTKHLEWAHEAETRIITDKEGRMPHDFRAIKSIHFGLKMPQEQIDAVVERMQGRGITYFKMERSPTAYSLKAVPLADPFTRAPRYLYHIVLVGEGAFDTYAEGQEKQELLPYLQKAVEIQRRDPYCTKVEFAERCSDRDRPSQIFVHYQYNSQWYNRYFTKVEIDSLYSQITDLGGVNN